MAMITATNEVDTEAAKDKNVAALSLTPLWPPLPHSPPSLPRSLTVCFCVKVHPNHNPAEVDIDSKYIVPLLSFST